MPRILIAGCGYVGYATALRFQQAGWEVEGWTGSKESAAELASASLRVLAVDLTEAAAVGAAAGEAEIVIQCASSRGGSVEDYRKIYLESARNLRSAFPHALHVFTSSTSVYGQCDGEWVTEESLAEAESETAHVLRETEKFVLAGGGIAARLAGIYGPGRSALLRKVLEGTAVIEEGAERFVNQVHRDDIAAALLHLVRRSEGTGDAPHIFNVSDNHPMTQRACYEWLAHRLDRAVPPFGPAVASRRRGRSNKRVSSGKLETLGWSPHYPTFEIGMRESILPAAGL
ncbi:MAG: NAD-dependent epimerase/dehydratase family protein [Chthoniobacterales bacterium]